MTEINLIPEADRVAEGYQSLHKKLAAAAIFLLALTAVSTLAVLIFFTFLATKRSDLVSQIQGSSSKVNSLNETEKLVFVVKGKAAAADKILSGMLDYSGIFATLSELIPQNVYFTDLKINGSKLDVSGRAKSSADMAGLISQLVGVKGSEIISGVSIGSLSRDVSGSYSFSLSALVNNKPKG